LSQWGRPPFMVARTRSSSQGAGSPGLPALQRQESRWQGLKSPCCSWAYLGLWDAHTDPLYLAVLLRPHLNENRLSAAWRIEQEL